jgi:hypothetical protein
VQNAEVRAWAVGSAAVVETVAVCSCDVDVLWVVASATVVETVELCSCDVDVLSVELACALDVVDGEDRVVEMPTLVFAVDCGTAVAIVSGAAVVDRSLGGTRRGAIFA